MCLLLGERPDLLDAVADDVPRRLVDVVADVVDRTREVVDVVAVERRHERPVQQVDELARHTIALVLRFLDLPQEVAVGRKFVEQAAELLRDADGVRRRAGEQPEELAILRDERDPSHAAAESARPVTTSSHECGRVRSRSTRLPGTLLPCREDEDAVVGYLRSGARAYLTPFSADAALTAAVAA